MSRALMNGGGVEAAGVQFFAAETDETGAATARAAGGEPAADLVETVRRAVIGDGSEFVGPFGPRPIVYADHTASGRAVGFIEEYVTQQVLPLYGNTHTTTSITGRQSTLFRTEARDIVRRSVNAGARDVVLFVGSGVTGAINKLVHLLGLSRPGVLHGPPDPATLAAWRRVHSTAAYNYANLPAKPDPADVQSRLAAPAAAAAAGPAVSCVVFVGPFEHHSNLLPWRESAALVVQIPEDPATGKLDLTALEEQLKAHQQFPDGSRPGKDSAFASCFHCLRG